jgi:hypothetical protein
MFTISRSQIPDVFLWPFSSINQSCNQILQVMRVAIFEYLSREPRLLRKRLRAMRLLNLQRLKKRRIVSKKKKNLMDSTKRRNQRCFSVPGGVNLPRAGTEIISSVNEQIFRKHVAGDRFQCRRRDWRIVSIDWPEVLIALRRVERGRIEEAIVHLRLHAYPSEAPLVALWEPSRGAIVEAERWPQWFKNFFVFCYPVFAETDTQVYTPDLLLMSTLIARRIRNDPASWSPSGDITQTLVRLLRCFRNAGTSAMITYSPRTSRRRHSRKVEQEFTRFRLLRLHQRPGKL